MTKFTFPVTAYYNKSKSFKTKLESFTEEMDVKLFQILNSNVSSLHSSDQQAVEAAYKPGERKLRDLENNYLPKWNTMQNENGSNPMNGVVQSDKTYKTGFEAFLDGKQPKEVLKRQERFEEKAAKHFLEDPANKSISEIVGGSVDVLKKVTGNDWYARLAQVTSLTTFEKDFKQSLKSLEKKHPEAAKAIQAKIIKGKEKLKKVQDSARVLSKQETGVKSANKKGLKGDFWAKTNSFSKKYGKYIHQGLDYGYDVFDSKAFKPFGKMFKNTVKGPVGWVPSIGINAYYNATDERVVKDYKDGKSVRATTKAVTGTVLDTVKDVGVIDGMLGGAAVGSAFGGIGAVPGALLGGGLGLANQVGQFIAPKGYEKVKNIAYKGVDWAADTANEIGKGIKSTTNKVKNGFTNAKNKIADGFSRITSANPFKNPLFRW